MTTNSPFAYAHRISPPMNFRGAPQVVFEAPDKTQAIVDMVKGSHETLLEKQKEIEAKLKPLDGIEGKIRESERTMSGRILDVEQKMARRGAPGNIVETK